MVAGLGASLRQVREDGRVVRLLLLRALESDARLPHLQETKLDDPERQIEARLLGVDRLRLQQGLQGGRVLAGLGSILAELEEHRGVCRGQGGRSLDRLDCLALVLRMEVRLGQV